MRTDILERRQDILKWIEENQSKAYMCRELKCKPETLNSYLQKMNINYAGNQSGKGIRISPKYKTAEEYSKVPTAKPHKLLEKLIRDGLREDKCEICGITYWNGVHLPLELHHKDCNHFNNSLDNVIIVCPNCHSIQPGNAGSNKGKYGGLAE